MHHRQHVCVCTIRQTPCTHRTTNVDNARELFETLSRSDEERCWALGVVREVCVCVYVGFSVRFDFAVLAGRVRTSEITRGARVHDVSQRICVYMLHMFTRWRRAPLRSFSGATLLVCANKCVCVRVYACVCSTLYDSRIPFILFCLSALSGSDYDFAVYRYIYIYIGFRFDVLECEHSHTTHSLKYVSAWFFRFS